MALAVAVVDPLAGVRWVSPGLVSRLSLEPLPDPGLPIPWTRNVLVPQVRLAVGTERLLGLVAILALGAVGLWALGGGVLLRSRGERLQGEYRLHRAVGASSSQLRRTAAREGWRVATGALLFGLPLGLLGGRLAAAAWPGPVEGWPGPGVPLGLPVVALLVATPLLLARGAAREALQAERLDVIPPPGLGPLIPVVQLALAMALLHTGGQLAQRVAVPDGSGGRVEPGSSLSGTLAFPEVTDVPQRGEVVALALDGLEGLPGVGAASLASAGTGSGIGVEDVVVTQCGACSMAGLPTPLKPVLVTHHAVSPDTFTILGLRLEEGRGITREDGWGGELVAVVSRSVARDHFDAQGPLGRRIRIGAAPGQWVRVVGVVEDRLPAVPDVSPEPHRAIYLSALQFPPQRLEVEVAVVTEVADVAEVDVAVVTEVAEMAEVAGAEEAGAEVAGAVEAGGEEAAAEEAVDAGGGREVAAGAAGDPTTGLAAWEARWRSEPAVALAGLVPTSSSRPAPAEALRWLAGMARLLGGLGLVGASAGLAAVLAHRVRERTTELALRRALGATRVRVMAGVLGEALRIGAGGTVAGAWLVLLVSGVMGRWLEGVPLLEPRLILGILAVLAPAVLLGALAPAWTAGRITPAEGLSRE